MKKENLIVEIGKEVLKSKGLKGLNWDCLSLVVDLEEGHFSQSGFLYLREKTIPFTPITKESRKLPEYFRELKSVIFDSSKKELRQALVQIFNQSAFGLEFFSSADKESEARQRLKYICGNSSRIDDAECEKADSLSEGDIYNILVGLIKGESKSYEYCKLELKSCLSYTNGNFNNCSDVYKDCVDRVATIVLEKMNP